MLYRPRKTNHRYKNQYIKNKRKANKFSLLFSGSLQMDHISNHPRHNNRRFLLSPRLTKLKKSPMPRKLNFWKPSPISPPNPHKSSPFFYFTSILHNPLQFKPNIRKKPTKNSI